MVEQMPTRVLLSGANGFLGTQIARQLINLPGIEILAMVRSKNREHGLTRLKRAWSDWDELLDALKDRVTVIPGDVTREDLGMVRQDYQDLASSITHIIHTVADLRLHAPLEELRLTNVDGTCHLLKLADLARENGIFRRFSHVSTAYVAGKREGLIVEDPYPENISKEHPNGKRSHHENNPEKPPANDGFFSNYEESKYEAERVVRESGVPYSIFRPGMVVGDSKTGEIKTFNTVYALFKLYLKGKLRFIPTNSSLTLNMVPVDYVAHAISNLSFNQEAEGRTFHLTAPPDTLPSIKELLNQVRVWAREKLDVKLPQPVFIPAAPLIQRITPSSSPGSGVLNILFTLAPYLDEKHTFSRENTENLLGPFKLKWEEYLPHLLEYAAYHGFFHRSERTVHEQVLYRLGGRSYPVKYYDITVEGIQEKPALQVREDIISAYHSLKESGVGPGDRVALVGLNSTRYLTLDVAIGLAGAVSVPLYYTSPPIEIKNILKASEAKLLFIGTPHLMKRLSELDLNLEIISFCRESQPIPRGIMSWSQFLEKGKDRETGEKSTVFPQSPVDFDDLATIRYTSGTTGTPKGVTFNQGHMRWMAEAMASLPPWDDRNREVRYLSFLPMNHVVEGILGTYSPYYAPAPLKIYFLEDFNQLASALPRAKPTIFFSVPRFYEKLWSQLKESFLGNHYAHLKPGILKKILKPLVHRVFLSKAGLDRCSQLIVGSATSSQHLIQDYHELGVEIHNAYGLTEAPLVTLNRRGANRIGTVGEPLPQTHLRIAGDGEVMVKGPQVTPGYFESDITPPKKEGWLLTGDTGFVTPEGSLVITGRKKELIINSYGKSIDPLRIEALLRDAPGTNEVMLVGEGKPYLIGLFWVEEEHHPHDIEETIHRVNQDLSRPEQVKRWALLPNDLSIDGGELTANMKLKREIITQRYQDVIDSLYQKTSHPLILHQGQVEEG